MPNTTAVGTDGNVPIYDPREAWRLWGLHEVYQGDAGLNKYVPKVLDYVIDPRSFTTYIVESIDELTLVPTLREIRPANTSITMAQADVLFGVGPGSQAQQMRAYLNKSVVPYSLQVDQLLQVGGSGTSYAKIFRGSVIDNKGEVISRVYDAAGNFVSENVPLETVMKDDHTVYSLKVLKECKTVTNMMDGELLTIVFYSGTGVVVSKAQVLVENTDYVKPLTNTTKYVTHISLKSPFMSASVVDQIDFPLNFPKGSAVFEGVVHYSDGSKKTLPVDGSKFRFFGYDQLLSSVLGQKLNLVLHYTLDEDEASFASSTAMSKFVAMPYTLMVTDPNLSYSVKLMPYPVWNAATLGYDLRWWLLTLDRSFVMDVSGLVTVDASLGAWDPYKLGSRQRIQVSLNLSHVSSSFKPFIHTQIVEVSLFNRPGVDTTLWSVKNESVPTNKDFGVGLKAKKTGAFTLSLQSGFVTYEDWLANMFDNTYPLVNSAIELSAPKPTDFRVTYDGVSKWFTKDIWDDDLDFGKVIEPNKNVTVLFTNKSSNGDLFVSMIELPIIV